MRMLLTHTMAYLLTFMKERGFEQQVPVPTTDRGSRLDHVYTNNLAPPVHIQVDDCYLSDQDCVNVLI